MRHRLTRTLLAALVAMVAAACVSGDPTVTAPGGTQPLTAEPSVDALRISPTPRPAIDVTLADLFGVWRQGPGGLWSFAPDGRYWGDTHGAIAHQPGYVGSYELVGDEVALVQTAASVDCPSGSTSRWLITALRDGYFSVEFLVSDCYPDAVGLTWEFGRISPENRTEAILPSAQPSTFPASSGNIRGDWHIVGTSAIVELDSDGTYWWDDEGELAWSPLETGAYRFTDDGLELTVQASERCESGDRLLLRGADISRGSDQSALFVMTAEAEDTCGRLSGPVVLMSVGI